MAFLGYSLTAVAQHDAKGELTSTPMVHDPVMAQENGIYYLFSTGVGIQQLTSSDGVVWQLPGHPVMTVIPKWTHDSVPGFGHHVWAPDIIRWHNRWWMAYSCSTFGKNGSAIGLLSTSSLSRGIWTDEGCIVTSRPDRDKWNAIDPCFIIDEHNQPWLAWGSFWDGIQLARLDTTMHLCEQPRTIARRHPVGYRNAAPNPTSKYAGVNAIEAPFIMRHDDYYYLFVSWDYCCRGAQSNYRVAVGRSRHVQGPYLDPDGRDMLQGGGMLFIEGDKQQYEAAGHCAVYHMDGRDIFICHGYSIAHHGASVLVRRPICWTADGWPQLATDGK